ncbi:SusC/RagA family TonB-linked outer membrane protein [Hymenobacter gummosus]|uniref:SusC/RagA family TonB-linked outer membrane protein n=1 Tax=Hymenobacter gummosus TaxID=1776032 RepID=A0A3S0JHJ9_9BACT|nr:SusC/RagA family TonB-linked outer membrane protein [Hymenobacter gummosus]RTQ50126.1 SusC/RagA family TonB-linked outer membrane protein [Hymenobacter gummosus]
MKKLLVASLLMAPLAVHEAAAQGRSISGRVLDASSGQGLPGVTVLVKGTTNGASTNADGSYTLNVAADAATLVFSSIGYVTVERPIGNGSVVNVTLNNDTKQLGEVVITGGLGLQRQAKEIGYATAKIEAQELNQARVTNVTNGLAGKVSGLQIQTLSNGINPQVRVTLRGTRSLTGENQALIVLDGVLVPNDVLTALNPDDIADVTILKGANAAAIYGSQASNGALIITTKKGSTTPTVTFSHTSQFEEISFLPKLQEEFGLGSNEYFDPNDPATFFDNYIPYENQQYGPRFNGQMVPVGEPIGSASGDSQMLPYQAFPDERRKFFNRGYQMQNNVSFAGGDEKSKIFLSFQNVRNNGIVPKDVFDRNTFRLNASREFGKLKVGFNTSYSQKRIDATSNLDRDNSVYWNIINTSVQIPIRRYKNWQSDFYSTPDNYYNEYYQNPYFILDNNRVRSREDYLIGNVDLGYKLTDWASIQYRLGGTIANQASNTYQNQFTYSVYSVSRGARRDIPGFVLEQTSANTRLNSDLFINLNKSFGDITISGILGNNVQHGVSRWTNTRSSALAVPDVFNLENRVGAIQGSAATYRYRQFSFFADATLGFRDIYFLHGSVRNDQTSLLSKKNRSIVYPSVDASVVFTDAIPGLKDNSFLNYGKIRAGIARVGQFNVGSGRVGVAETYGAYALEPFFGLGSGFPFGPITSFTASNQLISPDLKPEFTTSYEVGTELAFLNRRANFAATYYFQNSTNQTVSAGVSRTTGFSSYLLNAGKVQNKGVELDLNITPIQLDNSLTWKVGANYNYNNNEVKAITTDITELALSTGGNAQVYAIVGQPYPVLRGSYYVKDDQGRTVVTPTAVAGHGTQYFPTKASDLKVFGNTLPKHKYGFNTSLAFKGITLAAQAEYRTGYYVYHSIGENLDFTGGSQRSAEYGRLPFVFPNSSVRNPDGTFSANTSNLTPGGAEFFANAAYNTTVAENYVTKGDFFKIREVSLSYSVPASLLESTRVIKGVSLNLYARNLYTWVPKENQWTDPEFSFGNSNSNAVGINTINQTPPTRFYGASLSATF